MKKLLLLLIFCGLAHAGQSTLGKLSDLMLCETRIFVPNETGWTYAVQTDEKTRTESVWAMDTKRSMKAFIERMGSGGHICAAYGHLWRDGRPGEGEAILGADYVRWYADYHPNISYRTCRICGKCEKQELKWEAE